MGVYGYTMNPEAEEVLAGELPKQLQNAVTPRRAHEADAGFDLAPTEHHHLSPGRTVKMGTGIAVAIPAGHVGLISARSSVSAKGVHITGRIDSGYQGELFLIVTNMSLDWQEVSRETYLAQLIVVPFASMPLELVDDFEEVTERSAGGFGSSDVKP